MDSELASGSSNRLGADAKNTNYAGGNASAKGVATDPVTSQDVDLLWVKGSGGDLGTLTEKGLAVLRLDRFGRMALSEQEIVESNAIGGVMLLGLLSLGACFAVGFDSPFLFAALVFGLLIIPVAGAFKCPVGWPRTAMSASSRARSSTGSCTRPR